MEPMIQALLARRSVRGFSDRSPDPQLLEHILLAGINAPSAHDSRPWRIAALVTPKARQRLTEAMAAAFRSDMEKAALSASERRHRLERSQSIFGTAPVLLVLFASVRQPDNRLAKTRDIESLLTAQSVALAAGQILLAASFAGLGGCWFAAPLFCPGEVCDVCGLEPGLWSPQCLLALGYPAAAVKEKAAPRLEDSVIFL